MRVYCVEFVLGEQNATDPVRYLNEVVLTALTKWM